MIKRGLFLLSALLVMFTACTPAGPVSTGATGMESVETAPEPTKHPDLPGSGEPGGAAPIEPVLPDPALRQEFGFSQARGFSMLQPPVSQSSGKTSAGPALPIDPKLINNLEVGGGLTAEDKTRLWRDGFVVIETNEEQFGEVREQISEIHGQPYFLTTDAAFHALHLTFDELLKAMEKEQFFPLMKQITAGTLETARKFRAQAAGSGLEADALLAEAYLSVGLKLFDPQAALDPQVETQIAAQLEQIRSESGRDQSALIPGFEDDYSAYRPVGHYAGDEALEKYFRGMTWFGRVQFQLSSKNPDFKPSRAPLIITLALRQKTDDGSIPAQKWGQLHEVLSLIIGPVDDSSPLEYAALMDRVYGKDHSLDDLKDEGLWRDFVASRSALPAPQINSTFATSLKDMQTEHGWRFSGQRFTLDAFFLQNLVYDYVGTMEKPRKLPSGLDVMASLGSKPAESALKKMGETEYAHYPEQLVAMQTWAASLPEENLWKTFQSSWLYAFQALAREKDEAFPPFMRTDAWGYKELNSALGSWAELKHDTSLYAKMPEFGGGGGPPSSGPAPAYVEPNPEAFHRMAFAIQNLAEGLILRGMNVSIAPAQPGDFSYPAGVEGLLNRSAAFGERLKSLAEIAERERAGQPLTADDYETIQACLGPVECQVEFQNLMAGGPADEQKMPPIPIVAAAAGAENNLLEVATGNLNRIFVVAPLEGGLEIAQGSVFSYYEFIQPRSGRLTDQAWRDELAQGKHSVPDWAENFLSRSGGKPVNVTAFRPGDWYIVTPAGDDLNVRRSPGKGSPVAAKLYTGDYFEIVEGPKMADGSRWWKVRDDWVRDLALEGWVIEDSTWYVRAHGQ